MALNQGKFQHKINWNVVAIVMGIITICLVFFPNWNKKQEELLSKQIAILNTSLDNLKRENEKLLKETDSEWYNKFNNQKEYFQSVIILKDSLLKKAKHKLDSIRLVYRFAPLKGKMCFTNDEVDFFLIADVERNKFKQLYKLDSVDIADANKIIKLQDEKVKNLEFIISTYKKIVDLQPDKPIGTDWGKFVLYLAICSILYGLVNTLRFSFRKFLEVLFTKVKKEETKAKDDDI